MSEMYAGAILSNDWYASTHILNSIRAATGSQCKSISALVTCSRGRRSQTRRAAAFKTRCSGARVNCGNPTSIFREINTHDLFANTQKICETNFRNFVVKICWEFFLNFKCRLSLGNSSSELSRSAGLSRLSRRTGISVTPTGVEWMPLDFF